MPFDSRNLCIQSSHDASYSVNDAPRHILLFLYLRNWYKEAFAFFKCLLVFASLIMYNWRPRIDIRRCYVCNFFVWWLLLRLAGCTTVRSCSRLRPRCVHGGIAVHVEYSSSHLDASYFHEFIKLRFLALSYHTTLKTQIWTSSFYCYSKPAQLTKPILLRRVAIIMHISIAFLTWKGVWRSIIELFLHWSMFQR